jgi:formiminoglutamase
VPPEGGNSGTPFRQALEYSPAPLAGNAYVCLGCQPHSISRAHWQFAKDKGCHVWWRNELQASLEAKFIAERDRLAGMGCRVYVTVDADAAASDEVPGVSAPNVSGLSGAEILGCCRLAGRSPAVSSIDLVEINPRLDRDAQSARWGALGIWNFLIGLEKRPP